MNKIESKPSSTYFIGMAAMVVLAFLPFLMPENTMPHWIGIVFGVIGIMLIFGIKTTIFSPDEIRVKFLAGRKPIVVKKEHIVTIQIVEEAHSTAQRVGMMKKDRVIEIKVKDSKQMISVIEKMDKQFNEIHDFLHKHYKECWERGAGEIM